MNAFFSLSWKRLRLLEDNAFFMRFRAWLVGSAMIFAISCLSVTPAPDRRAGQLDDYLRGRGGSAAFSGTVAVFLKGEPILVKGYGHADVELGVPNSAETIYRIGSLTKPLVAATVLKLVENRSLALNDAICDHLPICPSTWQAVTVQHLLTHTSGIPDRFGELPAAPVSDMEDVLETYMKKTGTIELRHEPGQTYAYSNFGYVLLGWIIEEAAGAASCIPEKSGQSHGRNRRVFVAHAPLPR